MYEIKILSQKFYKDYPLSKYPELVHKENRPYLVLLMQIKNNKFAIPFRTNINHNNCYKFSKTNRNTQFGSGLDFSKAVIVNNIDYIGVCASIDKLEFKNLREKFHFIKKQFTKYVDDYIKYKTTATINIRLAIKYKFTTLQYFHKELGL